MKQALLNRFLRYVQFDTQSDGRQSCCPSTQGQMALADQLREELIKLGFSQVALSATGYLTALVPATVEGVPPIGFIAHLDTAPDFSGANVRPQLIENYDGGDIPLGAQHRLSPEEFPELDHYLGQTLITTDGSSLLGADDKAGIAEIITALSTLLQDPDSRHGDIYLCFTPDEEIGRGADKFDFEAFKAEWAYTVDGGELGGLEFENFNGATAVVTAKGNNCHPGSAYGVMVNAQTMAARFHAKMPLGDTPENSLDYAGFFHLIEMKGVTEEAQLTYLIRDFDLDQFEQRKRWLTERVEACDAQLQQGSLSVSITDSYYNMRDQLIPHPHIVEIAKQAMTDLGITPKIKPIRGGTDGSRLSYMGLPCPNLFTGGHNFHGKHEFICLESMVKATEVIMAICHLTAKQLKA
ncbi:peptidase T [Shewanella alkalitolerans]|uniref:peptidase T n=1 Tax=Shewanella alkalitolerans TaxID=2864209 RepID=UPI001C661593|nr:peptidase T [Shewanella alkalitolerans]QYJ97126.1 peptidase T [Shewanella alkalitolerans]